MEAIQMMVAQAFRALRTLREEESGQGLVEYALIIALVSIAVMTALGGVTEGLEGVFNTIKTTLEGA